MMATFPMDMPADDDLRRLKWTDNVRPITTAKAAEVLEAFTGRSMVRRPSDTIRYVLAFFKDDELYGNRERSKWFHITVGVFGQFVGSKQPKLADLTLPNLSRFFDWMISQGKSPEIAKQHQSRLHWLRRYAIRNQHIVNGQGGGA